MKKRGTRGRIKRFEQGAEQKDAAQYREERKKLTVREKE